MDKQGNTIAGRNEMMNLIFMKLPNGRLKKQWKQC